MPRSKRLDRSYISGIVLAAGTSTRMGQAKQLLPLEGRPLLQHVLDAALASCLDEVILVLGHQAQEVRAAIRIPAGRRLRVVKNDHYELGQSTSLRLGLQAASAKAIAAAVLLGDQPLVTTQLIDKVAAAFQDAGASVVRPVYVVSNGRRLPGHPVFLARQVWPEVEELRGDKGMRGFLAAHPDWLLEVPLKEEAPGDIDTWVDYLRAGGEASLAVR